MDTALVNAQVGEVPVVLRLRKKLQAWLERKSGSRSKLIDWLEGYELPAVGHDEEPYVWLLRALSRSDEAYRQEMARRLARLLDAERPYQHIGEEYDDRLVYNLLYLCGGLRRPDELGGPLARVYHFFKPKGEEWKDGEVGEIHPLFSERARYDLSGALREALITNQVNRDFEGAWEQMLEGRPHALLRGSRYAGVEGIAHMPRSAAERDKPAADKIGWALTRIIKYLEPDREGRHKTFNRLLNRVKRAWPNYGQWDEDILRQAIGCGWPEWAVLRLENLAVRLDEQADGTQRFLMWRYYLRFLDFSRPFKLLNTFLDGLVVEVRLNAQDSTLLNMIRIFVEREKLTLRSSGDTDVTLMTSAALEHMQEDWRKHREQWPEAQHRDTSLFDRVAEGCKAHIVYTRPPDKQQAAKKALAAAG